MGGISAQGDVQDVTEQRQGTMTYMFADRAGRGGVVKGQPYSA